MVTPTNIAYAKTHKHPNPIEIPKAKPAKTRKNR